MKHLKEFLSVPKAMLMDTKFMMTLTVFYAIDAVFFLPIAACAVFFGVFAAYGFFGRDRHQF